MHLLRLASSLIPFMSRPESLWCESGHLLLSPLRLPRTPREEDHMLNICGFAALGFQVQQ